MPQPPSHRQDPVARTSLRGRDRGRGPVTGRGAGSSPAGYFSARDRQCRQVHWLPPVLRLRPRDDYSGRPLSRDTRRVEKAVGRHEIE